IQFDGMTDGFVNLQAELAGTEDECADFLRTLRRGVKRGGFFGDEWRVFQQVERFDEFVALKGMLAAKTIRIRTLLNFFALKRGGGNAAAGDYFALVDARTNAGGKPGINLAKLHVGFGDRDAFDPTHFGFGLAYHPESC